VIRAGGGLLAVAVTVTACALVEYLAMAVAARHYLPGLRFSPRLVDRPTLRVIRRYSIDALLAMLAGRVSFQTDAIVINAFLLPQSITFFAIAGRLAEYAKDSLRVATMVLTPAVSALEAKGDSEGIRVGPYGIEGGALGTAIPNTLLTCAVGVYVCRTLGVGVGSYLRRSFLAPCAAALLPAGVWLAVWGWAVPDTWLSLAATTAAGLAG